MLPMRTGQGRRASVAMPQVARLLRPKILAHLLPYCFHNAGAWKQTRLVGSRKITNSNTYGAPEEIRTPDPQIRSLVLYPAELRALASAECAYEAAHSYSVQAKLARRCL